MGLTREYIALTKPGIIRGNLLTAAAGFLLAVSLQTTFSWSNNIDVALYMLGGTSLIIASGCVINNVFDRSIDAKMKRTQNRALVTGTVKPFNAYLYAAILGILGFTLLELYVNTTTALIGVFGLFFYAAVYTYFKRVTVHGTLIGAISGSVPPVAGYSALTNSIDGTAYILFAMLVCWQMPHFYAIAMYRSKEYAAATIPVLPVKKSMHAAKIEILIYIAGFIVTSSLLTFTGATGYTYLAVMTLLGFYWFILGLKGFQRSDNEAWGKSMFLFSLIVIVITSVMIAIGAQLP